ncbi:hypothetical protein H0H87_012583 [Tephrocybe sp. NHM501043]|nr:hypothetical protein H0H87_012583 [Tephrocybe sp. NHM501043]
MDGFSTQTLPIDTPLPFHYLESVTAALGRETESCYRVLEIIRIWGANDAPSNVVEGVQHIALVFRGNPKLLRDLNAVLPRGYLVQCPTDVELVEYVVLITSAGGQILSASGPDGVPNWISIRFVKYLLRAAQEYTNPEIEDDYKLIVSRRQLHLGKPTQILPPSFFLHNIEIPKFVEYHTTNGAFADIAKATVNDTPVCLKILRQYSAKEDHSRKSKAFFRELLLWSRLKHPNILPLLGASKVHRFMLISPWMDNGNLRTFLELHPEHDRLMASFEISNGLAYLHQFAPPIYHKDVKAVNILVSDDRRCYLADFGLSSISGSQRLESRSYSGEGTRRWQAPELVKFEIQEDSNWKELDFTAADVYAFGCTVLEIYTGEVPFMDLKDLGVSHAILNGNKPRLPDAHIYGMSEKFRDLVWSCWDLEPSKRPSMSRIKSFLKAELDLRDAPSAQPSTSEKLVDDIDPFQVLELPVATTSLQNQSSGGGQPPRSLDNHTPLHWSPIPPNEPHGSPPPSFASLNTVPCDLKIELPKSSPMSSSAMKDPSGLMTPTTEFNSPVIPASPLAGLEAKLAEELQAAEGVSGLELRSRLPSLHTFDLMTPPETPVISPGNAQISSPPRLSPLSPTFQPRPGIRAKVHLLNIGAAPFQPSSPIIKRSSSLAMPTPSTTPQARHSSLSSIVLSGDKMEPILSSTADGDLVDCSTKSFLTLRDPGSDDEPPVNSNNGETTSTNSSRTLNADAIEFTPLKRTTGPVDGVTSPRPPTSSPKEDQATLHASLNPNATPFTFVGRRATQGAAV